MSEAQKLTNKLLYQGYWIVTQFFQNPGSNLPLRGWSFKVMLADYTDANGNYNWDQHEDGSGFYHCAWCQRRYFGDDEAAALEAGKKIVEAQLSEPQPEETAAE